PGDARSRRRARSLASGRAALGRRVHALLAGLAAALGGFFLEPALGLRELGAALRGGCCPWPWRPRGGRTRGRRHRDGPLTPSPEGVARELKEGALTRGGL